MKTVKLKFLTDNEIGEISKHIDTQAFPEAIHLFINCFKKSEMEFSVPTGNTTFSGIIPLQRGDFYGDRCRGTFLHVDSQIPGDHIESCFDFHKDALHDIHFEPQFNKLTVTLVNRIVVIFRGKELLEQ